MKSGGAANAQALRCTAVESAEDNYVWMLDDGRDAVAIDPGEALPVRNFLSRRDLRLAAILLTHHHADHVGGVAELQQHAGTETSCPVPVVPGIPVYGPVGDRIEGVTHPVGDGARIDLARPAVRFEVLATPGHTLDHLVYLLVPHDSEGPIRMFCGDTLFSCGCGRVFEGTQHQMVEALDRLRGFPESTLMHCAHEYTLHNIAFARSVDPHNANLIAWQRRAKQLRREGTPTLPTSLKHECEVNPFLRIDDVAFRDRIREKFSIPGVDRVDVFSTLRTARNSFPYGESEHESFGD